MFCRVLIAVTLVVAASGQTPYKRCLDGSPGPVSLNVSSCTESPCRILIGDLTQIDVEFMVEGPVNKLPTRVDILEVDSDEEEESDEDLLVAVTDGCAGIVSGCPQKAGEAKGTYEVIFSGINPGTRSNVRIQMDDQHGRVFCATFAALFISK